MKSFSEGNHEFVSISNFLQSPQEAVEDACLQKFANITPAYPGVRAAIPSAFAMELLAALSPLLDTHFGKSERGWELQAWYSLVTARPDDLVPMQCLPHVDGTDPDQIAMMLYLHHTAHGGTSFFRHRSTGLSALTEETFPKYREALKRDVEQSGLPNRAYVTDGAPYFEKIHETDGAFNQAILYRGNVLHSGMIDNNEPLPPGPREGRLTINAFFRPTDTR
ncbi:hypothetical protein INR77_03755 [Erythrobacter sp. SCSIO 43205]|uniref:DUF6445 family protein n=1 Tax=Erythrobacter sp. SCSIO 43205 TaxID=2779361 RepID=UPI001CA9E192|nr:DUF6445 family protein [Erythrobacter sp. SCSIO 43205]UAB78837.1 hypothetical protein INR77_03755 [Erythrobacter sp. SCSIO 43205]